MCNSTTPAASLAADLPPCPPWCDPRFCEVTEGDVAHCSTPVLVDTVSAVYRVSLIRYDELAFPDEWDRPPSLRLFGESHELAQPGPGDVPLSLSADFSLAEVLPLIGALAAQHALAGVS
ncbi:MAG TPA: hypothetical protein VHH34_04135 [Pseudonocardiaceae bacterium]|nr:hypothetical protein [Pseudonocardiaceae bacterium]